MNGRTPALMGAVTATDALAAWPETFARIRNACGDQSIYQRRDTYDIPRGDTVDLDQVAADITLVVARAHSNHEKETP